MLEQSFEINTESVNLTDEQFFNLCQSNDFLRFERTADKQIIVMTPSGIWTSNRNNNISTYLTNWNNNKNLGYVFGSDAGFTLPNNAVRAPDASFVYKEKINALSDFEKERFAHVVPDFVVELMSPSDGLKHHQDKMQEYMENGVLLGWLIIPKSEEVHIYRQSTEIQIVKGFDNVLSGEEILPDFRFHLSLIR
ncbi:MAG: Uma2 family endonuclease [Cytophagales bacterium]